MESPLSVSASASATSASASPSPPMILRGAHNFLCDVALDYVLDAVDELLPSFQDYGFCNTSSAQQWFNIVANSLVNVPGEVLTSA